MLVRLGIRFNTLDAVDALHLVILLKANWEPAEGSTLNMVRV